jgi:cellulose biosynthesis protein BcsQ
MVISDRIEPIVDEYALPTPAPIRDSDDTTTQVSAPAVVFPAGEMAALYRRVRADHPTDRAFIVQVVGAHRGAGATSIAHGIGSIAADLSAQRVLLCDATASKDLLQISKVVIRRSLPKLAAYAGFTVPSGLIACPLDKDRSQTEMVGNTVEYADALSKFRSIFDMIVIDTPPTSSSDFALAMARHADAVVIVVEAEKTRAPMLSALINQIEASGGRVAGVVLNKRVQHIPGFFYRRL